MVETVQNMMVIVGGLVLVVILSWILVLVHRQTKRMKELEFKLRVTDKSQEVEEKENG